MGRHLTVVEALGVRESYRLGANLQDIAREYGSTYQACWDIVNRRTFANAEESGQTPAVKPVRKTGLKTWRKISPVSVREIRALHLEGHTFIHIAIAYGVTRQAVSDIIHGRSHTDVEGVADTHPDIGPPKGAGAAASTRPKARRRVAFVADGEVYETF